MKPDSHILIRDIKTLRRETYAGLKAAHDALVAADYDIIKAKADLLAQGHGEPPAPSLFAQVNRGGTHWVVTALVPIVDPDEEVSTILTRLTSACKIEP